MHGEPSKDEQAVVVIPVGRRASALFVPKTLDGQVDVVASAKLEPHHLPEPAVVVCLLDGRDEEDLNTVAEILERFRPHGAPLPIVAYAPPMEGKSMRRRHLGRLAMAWHATVISPIGPECGLSEVLSGCLECLVVPGLIGLDPADYLTVLEPPSVAEMRLFTCERVGDNGCRVPGEHATAIQDNAAPAVLATFWLPDRLGLIHINAAFENLTEVLRDDAAILMACVPTKHEEPTMAVVGVFDP